MEVLVALQYVVNNDPLQPEFNAVAEKGIDSVIVAVGIIPYTVETPV
jgi:hypothetical protein